MVEICPTPYSAATGSRASRVQPPRDCAPGSALVLKYVWMKLHHHSFFVQYLEFISSAFVL